MVDISGVCEPLETKPVAIERGVNKLLKETKLVQD